MPKRAWTCTVLFLLLAGCSGSSTPKPEGPATGSSTIKREASATGAVNNTIENSYGGPAYLNQNWDHETRMEWWFTSQGSRVLPYDWFLALEQSDSEELVSSNANLVDRMRFIGWPKDPVWNPDGLPIGFVRDIRGPGKGYFGFNCSACHTSLIERDGKVCLVDGGPAHSDFDRFVTQIGEAMQKTANDPDKFARFRQRILPGDAAETVVDALKTNLTVKAAELAERTKINHPPFPNGYARLDAFGNIFNEGAVFAINQPENAKPADAPVSYPVVWDAPHQKIVQWNGAAVNAGIGPYTRNVGEVVGVFGGLRVTTTEIAGHKKLRYEHHVDIAALERMEEILTTLWSPKWPEDLLGKLDSDKAARGKIHFEAQCIRCHAVVKDRTDPRREMGEMMIPVADLGTDPLAADNPFNSKSKTGLLQGEPMIPLLEYLPSPGLIERFGPESGTNKVVGNGVMGILREELGLPKVLRGLPPYIKEAKANIGPPRYKARPLNGIWASAPFLHNGSVPNLTELLKKPDDRVAKFFVGSWEMDVENVGFSTAQGEHTSEFDASVRGNSNKGHDFGTALKDEEKRELIEFIKSL